MKKIVIFSGTTEGRVLSTMLAAEKVHHTVCVATDYGREMMDENPYASLHVGRMDEEEMLSFLEDLKLTDENLVIDATHPYATAVTANIKKAAAGLGIRYVRVVREEEQMQTGGIRRYEDITECAAAVDQTVGNILLTTGSKELGKYFAGISQESKARTYIRVLPSMESLKLCEREAIEPDHIIAMQGPFGRELNEAIIRQYDIKHLITKDGGSAGGFREKIDAASACGAQVHVIVRPHEEGVGVDEAFAMITGKTPHRSEPALQISLIGLGMGDPDSLTVAAKNALCDCDAIFGAKRLLRGIFCRKKYEMFLAADIIPVLEKEKIQKAAIVFSGDTGFYSGAKGMGKALKEWRKDAQIRVIPGISSFGYLAAKLGESYDDACLFSIHGKNADKDLQMLLDKVRYQEKVFVLLSDAGDVARIAGLLIRNHVEGTIVTGTNLSYENETIREMSFREALEFDDDGIVCALIYNRNPGRRHLIKIKKDDDFIRDKVPMTKACIRHESILRLGLREGDIFYDIGGGTGSVAIEAAGLHPGLMVYTIEKKQEAAELIRQNIKKSDLSNITVVEGDAARVLGDMPKPDCVFIGGSGGELPLIMEILRSKGEGIRYVLNAVSIETIAEVREIINTYHPRDEEAVMISVSDVHKTGAYHMPKAQNPVWIFSFTL
ncbi:MAG: precorrin-6A reductase [Lachnospiraceae bacterium]|nr:precorrin-6A reductase [Lachnospiraceae bacterium]